MARRRTSYRGPAKLHANVLLLANPASNSEKREKVNLVLDQYDEGLLTPGDVALKVANSYPRVFVADYKELLRRERAFGAVIDLMYADEQGDFVKYVKSRRIDWEDMIVSPDGAYEAATWLAKHRGLR